MYQEICKKEKISGIKMVAVILVAAVFLILFNALANRFLQGINASIIDTLTLLFASAMAYMFIRKFITSYKYMLIENDFIIQEIIGSKEKLLLNINVHQIMKLEPTTHSSYTVDAKKKYATKRKLNKKLKDLEIYYLIYEQDDKHHLIEIQPSYELFQIIKKKIKLKVKCSSV